MNQEISWLVEAVKGVLVFYGIFYVVPYLMRRAWINAENKNKTVCDVCWRDINKVNEALKKAGIIK